MRGERRSPRNTGRGYADVIRLPCGGAPGSEGLWLRSVVTNPAPAEAGRSSSTAARSERARCRLPYACCSSRSRSPSSSHSWPWCSIAATAQGALAVYGTRNTGTTTTGKRAALIKCFLPVIADGSGQLERVGSGPQARFTGVHCQVPRESIGSADTFPPVVPRVDAAQPQTLRRASSFAAFQVNRCAVAARRQDPARPACCSAQLWHATVLYYRRFREEALCYHFSRLCGGRPAVPVCRVGSAGGCTITTARAAGRADGQCSADQRSS